MLQSEQIAPSFSVVDLERGDELPERQEADVTELISSSSSSCSLSKIIAAAVVILFCLSGVVYLVVWQANKSSVIPPPPTPTTTTPRPSQIPTVRPLPKNASDLSAENLLIFVFDKTQLDYMEVRCLPQSPPTYKFMLQVANYANFTGLSNTRKHARIAVSRQAAEIMFGFDYSDKFPIPPPPQACQRM